MKTSQALEVVDEIFELYDVYGYADYIGEPVSQLEHMSQAAELALNNGADDELVLAAFFHDIGHICVARNKGNNMNGLGTKRHEQIGAEFLLRMGFPKRIADLVEHHVQAKRYLTFRHPEYLKNLSEASLETLKIQGGPMIEEEALHFEKDPLFYDSLLLRKWDEQAKETGKQLIDLDHLKTLAAEVLSRR